MKMSKEFYILIFIAVTIVFWTGFWFGYDIDSEIELSISDSVVVELLEKIDRLEGDLNKQVQQKNQALDQNKPLKQEIAELKEQLEGCTANVLYGEQWEPEGHE